MKPIPVRSGARAPRRGLTKIVDRSFAILVSVVGLGFLAFIALFIYILYDAAKPSIAQFGIAFLWGQTWNPSPVSGPVVLGVLPFIIGTLLTSAVALLIAIPLSLGIAIFLTEQAPIFLRAPFGFTIELLAAVPSVIYGLWGIFVLVPFMRSYTEPVLAHVGGPLFSGPVRGTDVLTAGVVLAIMIIPTISAISREALGSVPQSQREAALSLGATRWEATRISVLSYARTGLFGAVILGLGRAVGETMAVTMTIGNSNHVPMSLFDQGQTIASLIANEFTEATSPLELSALIEAGLVLLVITLLINIFARFLIWRVVRSTGEVNE
jgi:phosphate transport system permease protein